MILKILIILIVISAFVLCKSLVWLITEMKDFPSEWDYKPWNCNKCLGFWFPLAVYTSIWYILGLWEVLVFGSVLVILDTIAKVVDENKKFK